MRKIVVTIIILASVAVIAFAAENEESKGVVLPAKISKEDMTGSIFIRLGTVEQETYGTNTLEVTSMSGSDEKFSSGIFKTGKHRIELTEAEPYGVDELMYMLEGTMVLTSADGIVQEIGPGEAVTIPREWTGVLETDGYLQLWALYSRD